MRLVTKLYEETLKRLSSKEKRDPNIVLNALSDVISQYTLDNLVDGADRLVADIYLEAFWR